MNYFADLTLAAGMLVGAAYCTREACDGEEYVIFAIAGAAIGFAAAFGVCHFVKLVTP